jgi:D-alanyl-D-alanine carboxypeptidase
VAPRLVLASESPGGRGGIATCAAVAVALAAESTGAVLIAEIGAERPRRPTMLASEAARSLEAALGAAGFPSAAARGRVCWLGLPDKGWHDELQRALALEGGAEVVVAFVPGELWNEAVSRSTPIPAAALLRADPPAERALCALAFRELTERGIRTRIATRALGPVAARRALAGLDPGGAASRHAARLATGLGVTGSAGRVTPGRPGHGDAVRPAEAGQALPLALGGALAVVLVALALAAIGGAVGGAARAQRAADLSALSAGRSMRDDLPRLLAPARLPGGAPNPEHLAEDSYLARAEAAARQAAARNGVDTERLRVSFPDRESFPPLRVRVDLRSDVTAAGAAPAGELQTRAEAQAAIPGAYTAGPATASGGGYSGPLAYRQGKPMRPDVAMAFDRLAAAARHAGLGLVITSAYRSDAEQARLFAQNPDPRWVAPPGHSLHRCATELDLGPAGAYGWLHANAGRFGFLARYAWRPWQCGTRG